MLMKPSKTSSFVGLQFFFFFFDSVKFEKCPTVHDVSNSSTPLLKFISLLKTYIYALFQSYIPDSNQVFLSFFFNKMLYDI